MYPTCARRAITSLNRVADAVFAVSTEQTQFRPSAELVVLAQECNPCQTKDIEGV